MSEYSVGLPFCFACKLKSSAVNTSSFSFCFSLVLRRVSEIPPLKIFHELQVALFLIVIAAWFVVKQKTILSLKFYLVSD